MFNRGYLQGFWKWEEDQIVFEAVIFDSKVEMLSHKDFSNFKPFPTFSTLA